MVREAVAERAAILEFEADLLSWRRAEVIEAAGAFTGICSIQCRPQATVMPAHDGIVQRVNGYQTNTARAFNERRTPWRTKGTGFAHFDSATAHRL